MEQYHETNIQELLTENRDKIISLIDENVTSIASLHAKLTTIQGFSKVSSEQLRIWLPSINFSNIKKDFKQERIARQTEILNANKELILSKITQSTTMEVIVEFAETLEGLENIQRCETLKWLRSTDYRILANQICDTDGLTGYKGLFDVHKDLILANKHKTYQEICDIILTSTGTLTEPSGLSKWFTKNNIEKSRPINQPSNKKYFKRKKSIKNLVNPYLDLKCMVRPLGGMRKAKRMEIITNNIYL